MESYIVNLSESTYFRIYLCHYTDEGLKFHGRHGLSSEQRESWERFVDFEREREREREREGVRVCETCIISNTSSLRKLQIDGITEGRQPLLYRINDICVMRK